MIRRCDIFCRVVDNLGDAGVCWRLARRLARGHGLQVRLWIDAPPVLERFLAPSADDQALLDGGQVAVLAWVENSSFGAPAELVIETFGCDIPVAYARALAATKGRVHWYNLEYLSAEAWVEGCHALPSPHPVLPLQRVFFFPGFTAATGGLLREPALIARRRTQWSTRLRPSAAALRISLFCYPDAPLAALLDALVATSPGARCQVFQGAAQETARAWAAAHPGHGLDIDYLPWLSQDGFDEVLWECDFNVVRGEDSFVRAQWAGRPFLWDIYPQDDGAHLVKMAAFLQRYRAGLEPAAAAALGALWQPWIRREPDALAAAWKALLPLLQPLTSHAEDWCDQLAGAPDLADALLAHAAGSGGAHRLR